MQISNNYLKIISILYTYLSNVLYLTIQVLHFNNISITFDYLDTTLTD